MLHLDAAPSSANGIAEHHTQPTPASAADRATSTESRSPSPAASTQDDTPAAKAAASAECTEPTRSPRKRAVDPPANTPCRKRVRWSTITVHEFGVGLGGSAISDRGGPSIGLADKPEFTWTTKVGEMAECSEGIHRFTPDQRTRLLKAAGVSDGMISRYARETSIILKSRRKAIAEGVEESSDEDDDGDDILLEDEDDSDDSSDDDSSDDDLDMYSRKRKAESQHSIYMSHPQFVPLRRPRMIPANYV